MTGMAMISTFFVGIAYLGDVTDDAEQGLAVGIYTTFMGSGFAIGSAIGGQMAHRWGHRSAFAAAMVFAVIGFLVARLGLRREVGRADQSMGQREASVGAFHMLLHDRSLLIASMANLINNMWYSGLVSSFFSLYAEAQQVTQAAIGTMFASRAVFSTGARLPTGLAVGRLRSKNVLLISLGVAALSIAGIAITGNMWLLGAFLALEGIAYGMYLSSGQAYLTEHSERATRGAAIGVYSTAGGIGGTGGPFVLGFVAQFWGLRTVMWCMAGMIVVGLLLVLALGDEAEVSERQAATALR